MCESRLMRLCPSSSSNTISEGIYFFSDLHFVDLLSLYQHHFFFPFNWPKFTYMRSKVKIWINFVSNILPVVPKKQITLFIAIALCTKSYSSFPWAPFFSDPAQSSWFKIFCLASHCSLVTWKTIPLVQLNSLQSLLLLLQKINLHWTCPSSLSTKDPSL